MALVAGRLREICRLGRSRGVVALAMRGMASHAARHDGVRTVSTVPPRGGIAAVPCAECAVGGAGSPTRSAARRTASTAASADVLAALRGADAVCFDVDSTVTQEEGIDELARFAGVYDGVKAMTTEAMGGDAPFGTTLSKRLELINPTRDMVERFLREKPAKLNPGVRELVDALRARGRGVHLVSGGFTVLIEPVAAQLGVPMDNVIANVIHFNEDGSYAGFDKDIPTSESGGKAVAVQKIMDEHGYKSVVCIGDGANDLEAKPPATAVIGFGGVTVRDKVAAEADWFVKSMHEIIAALDD